MCGSKETFSLLLYRIEEFETNRKFQTLNGSSVAMDLLTIPIITGLEQEKLEQMSKQANGMECVQ